MAPLHNRVSRKELKQKVLSDQTPRTTLSFYRYVELLDPVHFRDALYRLLRPIGVLGRIYVATEGINAQISVPAENLSALRDCLDSIPGLQQLRLNIAVQDDGKSFFVLDVKVRKKIVADGIEDPSFRIDQKGKYLSAEAFNQLAADPNTILVDMRNYYEYEVGRFKGAVEVPSDTFREQLPMAVSLLSEKKDQNIVMYCTGGIRCEKASAFLLHHGFQHVYHLEGGIIHYVNQVREQGLPNYFIGKNFVFDDRLGERITNDVLAVCHLCGEPADTHVNCANDACHLLFIQCESCARKLDSCCSATCQQQMHLPVAERKKLRQGIDRGQHIFNKSRQRIGRLSSRGGEDPV
ncbi:MAG: rhodanese-related sulfurtransferase [Bacteroidetes bacterium]|nr:rhodanese-related sulfurtransferase [Bacteroidota bacterium]